MYSFWEEWWGDLWNKESKKRARKSRESDEANNESWNSLSVSFLFQFSSFPFFLYFILVFFSGCFLSFFTLHLLFLPILHHNNEEQGWETAAMFYAKRQGSPLFMSSFPFFAPDGRTVFFLSFFLSSFRVTSNPPFTQLDPTWYAQHQSILDAFFLLMHSYYIAQNIK